MWQVEVREELVVQRVVIVLAGMHEHRARQRGDVAASEPAAEREQDDDDRGRGGRVGAVLAGVIEARVRRRGW